MAKKKSAKPLTQAQMNNNLMKKKAIEKIVEHNRDYLKVDITMPLGNPALKKVHTNQFMWTTLPKNFALANWGIIAKALNSATNRYEGYVRNKWYIESVDISVDASGKAEMKLGLNAFASTHQKYYDDYNALVKAYIDVTTKNKDNDKTNAVTTGNNTSLKGGWTKWLDNWVAEVVGNTTDPLQKAKKIDKAFKSVTHWSDYANPQKTGGNPDKYESVFNGHYMNCADGANILCAMFDSAGLDATIMHTYKHYIVRLRINGKTYYTDCSASDGQLCNKPFNNVWGEKGGDEVGKRITMD